MPDVTLQTDRAQGLDAGEVARALEAWLGKLTPPPKRALLLPPDYTRVFSGVGGLTARCAALLRSLGCQVDVMPALGTHAPMTPEEILEMFEGAFAQEDILVHDWRKDVTKIGEVPADYVHEVSDGLLNLPVPVEVNRRLLDPAYDLILSIGQVVPHEVAGMANYSKNIFVGCGGYRMINASHLLGAAWGVRRILGVENSPVRAVFDYAQEHFLRALPLAYLLTVSAPFGDVNRLRGLYLGCGRALFAQAAAQSARLNITQVDKPARKIVAYMDEKEYKTVWVGNKAIYRTCMALAPGGEILIIAPGVRRFGEDIENDALIRKYGYHGAAHTLALMREIPELAANTSVVAHLMQGSADGAFDVTYATDGLTKAELSAVGYGHMPLAAAMGCYAPPGRADGYYRTADGEPYLSIAHPAAGLWTA
ncbi:hypothetical protein FACS1894196_1510 [Clostridia bacterium]|nr:hypothetical protein FACS1894196_1510 [Clostridia bacterium]